MLFSFYIISDFKYAKSNICVPKDPLIVDHGSIAGISNVYWIYYRGNRKESGDDCCTKVRVTKRRYEELIYGYKDGEQ